MNRLTYSLSAVARVDRLAVARVVLDARSGAAPEGIEGCVVEPHVAGPCRLEVSHHARRGILRRQDAVEERALEVVDVSARARARVYSERVSRSMLCVQQVSMVFAEPRCFANSVRREEMFDVAVAAGGEGARAVTTAFQKNSAARRVFGRVGDWRCG